MYLPSGQRRLLVVLCCVVLRRGEERLIVRLGDREILCVHCGGMWIKEG